MKRWLWILFLPALALAGSSDWELSGNKDGVIIYRRNVPGSHVVAFKGEGTVDAPLWKVASVMLDDPRAPEWIDSLLESRVVRHISPSEFIEYNLISTPPLLRNRDFVTHVKFDFDAEAKTFKMHYQSMEDPAVPPSKNVRGDMISDFILTSIDHGKKTKLAAEIHADPKGWIPKWLVNFFQKSWPHDTFMGLRSQVTKADVRIPAEFSDVLQQLKTY